MRRREGGATEFGLLVFACAGFWAGMMELGAVRYQAAGLTTKVSVAQEQVGALSDVVRDLTKTVSDLQGGVADIEVTVEAAVAPAERAALAIRTIVGEDDQSGLQRDLSRLRASLVGRTGLVASVENLGKQLGGAGTGGLGGEVSQLQSEVARLTVGVKEIQHDFGGLSSELHAKITEDLRVLLGGTFRDTLQAWLRELGGPQVVPPVERVEDPATKPGTGGGEQ